MSNYFMKSPSYMYLKAFHHKVCLASEINDNMISVREYHTHFGLYRCYFRMVIVFAKHLGFHMKPVDITTTLGPNAI